MLVFPKKNWFFNLSKAALSHRLTQLNQYLGALVTVTPQLLEIGEFPCFFVAYCATAEILTNVSGWLVPSQPFFWRCRCAPRR